MGWTRFVVALLVGLSFIAPAGAGGSGDTISGDALHLVSAGGVKTLLPPKWEFRPLPRTPDEHRQGLQASEDVLGMIPTDLRHPSLEAYWVDATTVGVPSDYYRLAARGPIQDMLRSPGCHREDGQVMRSTADTAATGQYVATMSGSCEGWSGSVRWASFVAAPGFGPVRRLGIPRSGLYVVRASVADGPDAERQLRLLMNHVSFGGTTVQDFLTAAGVFEKLP